MARVVKLGIESVLAEKLLEVLTKHCITDVTDDSEADHVILGKPTEELRESIVISIHMQHPLGPSADTDAIMVGTPRQVNERPDRYPAEFGSIIWKIIGAVQINVRQRESYDEAIKIISTIYERVKYAIDNDPDLASLSDDWGNTMFRLRTFQAAGYASGGGDISINIRWVSFRADVVRPVCRS
jgi:hypothetical protein